VVIAALTKRAQIPFSSWLPAAIAAPTPVSALVHSSTLVTAGVYLLIRFSPLFTGRSIMTIVLVLGILTIVISSLGAIFEIDLKKIIALSTLRQLGLIMLSLGLGYYNLALFHLLTHALFKASLFLCAGALIHRNRGSQDLRELNGVDKSIPVTLSCLVICSLSLSGFPFLSAFFSKDKIVEEALIDGGNLVGLLILVLSLVLTGIYSFRLIFYTAFVRRPFVMDSAVDSPLITKRILLLTIGGIIGGRLIR
jgi:NADH-ubiquinone oxidoreductase chain 5